MAAVQANGVSRLYGSLAAIDDLTCTVEAGEIVGLLGANGAGKTTAIRVLTTVLAPTRGAFAVAGMPHTRPAEIRRRIGVLPESSGYPARQTGEEYLRYHARLHGQSRPSAATVSATLLADVGLGPHGRSRIATYSRGMRQRLGLARALVNDPSVVFLDEPTLGLDPAGQRQIAAGIRRIASERGAAVILSTHLLPEVEDTCARVVILRRGRVVADGSVADVVARAAAPRSVSVRVATEDATTAAEILARTAAVARVERGDGGPGALDVTLAAATGDGLDAANAALRALVDGGVAIRAFQLEGARLGDAFLAVTEGV
jgi:ABC-2 type transport system ATP-binding protein